MSVPRRIMAFIELAAQDVDAAETLATTQNRYSAYHCQQAIEKLAKALLLQRGIEAGTEHRLDVLFDRIPEDDPWSARLRSLDKYTPFATTFRYPTPGGRIPAALDPAEVLADVVRIRQLVSMARKELVEK